MSRWHSYLNTSVRILEQYQGEEPFSHFLKKFFSATKKHGSNDRKQIAHLCYCYFRMGKAGSGLPVDEKIIAGLFFSPHSPNELLEKLRPEWNEKAGLSFTDKCSQVSFSCSISDIFPWQDQLSEGIDKEAFTLSHFQQPDLFLRIRPGNEQRVKEKLSEAGVAFRIINDQCLALPNSTKADSILKLNAEAVIQDLNSQNTGKFIQSAIANLKSKIEVWDSCAGSGGKSIMAYDINPEIKLTVSDVRESILANLEKRFSEAGLRKFKDFVSDLTPDAELPVSPGEFDLIIADVPCSGSGTWSRTPEQLYYFDEKKMDAYSALQKKIIPVLIPYLKAGGHLLYITCSVFKKENEDIVSFINDQSGLNPVKTELLKGYDEKADTLFASLLQKPLLQH